MKALLAGASLALAAGLTMGFSMQPHLDAVGDRPEGPQIFANAEQSTGPFDDNPYSHYHGKLPDYVVGTDWKRATAADLPRPAAVSVEASYAEADVVTVEPTTEAVNDYQPPAPAPHVTYPSLDGGGPEPVDTPARSDADEAPAIIG